MIGARPLVPLTYPVPKAFPRRVSVFGSTGSIGTSTLDIIREHRDTFTVESLVAGTNIEKLAEQAVEFNASHVGIADSKRANHLRKELSSRGADSVEIHIGQEEIASLAREDASDIHVAAIVGMSGLKSVLEALRGEKCVALANKESLVVGGNLVADLLTKTPDALLIPVDSEHSALFQSLAGEKNLSQVSSLVLTASGGPFRTTPLENFSTITPERAVKHPKWSMGPKVSIDSATMMNKSLEVIEASWLYGLKEDALEVVIHPQSIVHSLVRFVDGSIIAQLSEPDMKGPIGFALGYPDRRLSKTVNQLSFEQHLSLEFEPVEHERFPAIQLVRSALRTGPAACVVFNVANEVAVELFRLGELGFTDIVPLVEKALSTYSFPLPSSFDELQSRCQEIEEELWHASSSNSMRQTRKAL